MKVELTKLMLRNFVKENGLRDISELKTYCSVLRKLSPNSVNNLQISDESGNVFDVPADQIESFINDVMHVMTLPEYLELSPRTLNRLATQELDEMHMVLGVVGEAGELADAYKRNMAYGTPLDRINVSEELGGDSMWYISNWYKITGYSIYRSMFSNIAKLKVRYPDGFSGDKAINRDLKAEREALEKHVGNETN